MNTKELLHTLAEQLDCLYLTKESKNVLNIIKKSIDLEAADEDDSPLQGTTPQDLNEVERWAAVLAEAQTPIPPQIFEKGLSLILQGAAGIYENGLQLQKLNPEEMGTLIEMAKKVPGISTKSGYDFVEMKKVAELFPKFQDGIIKNSQDADLVQSLVGPAMKSSTFAMKVVPFIGVFFSFSLAVKNLIYGIWELTILREQASKVGMSITDTMYPAKLAEKINEFSNNPESLIELIRTTKSGLIFVDEGISLIANTIDAFKDLIFLAIELWGIFTPWGAGAIAAGTVDFGLSVIIALIEWEAEEASAGHYNRVIEMITELAENKIQSITPVADESINYSDLSFDELFDMLSDVLS
jgi:hypothetical protein